VTPGDVVAIISVVSTVLIAALGYVLNQKNKEIDLLKTKNELLEKANDKLERQNLKLEITGQVANQFFRQLPAAMREYNEESG
jgi:hypothetical protein